jgi:glutamate dehydrogenase (NAD(P)+)
MHVGHTETAIVTGKPVVLGGSHGRREATGRGVMICTRETARHLEIDMRGATVAVQGFGNVGSVSADLISKLAARIVAVTDWKGGVFNEHGLDVPKLIEWTREHKTVDGFPGGEPLTNEQIFTLDVDFLIPAALENQITIENADGIKAKAIVEGANGPTTPEADEVFRNKGMLVIPDVYANAGGVTVSYFEWLKNLSHVRLGRLDRRRQAATELRLLQAIETATGRKFSTAERESFVKVTDELAIVNSGLEDTMIVAYQEIRDTLRREPKMGDLRTAAFVLAINKVAIVYEELGIFP